MLKTRKFIFRNICPVCHTVIKISDWRSQERREGGPEKFRRAAAAAAAAAAINQVVR